MLAEGEADKAAPPGDAVAGLASAENPYERNDFCFS